MPSLQLFADLARAFIAFIRDPGPVIAWGGYPVLGAIVFLETGLFMFFLPGDSLLVVAGFYAAKGLLSIGTLNLLLGPLAILGDACAYAIGKRLGARAEHMRDGRLLNRRNIAAAQAFYAQHGGKAIVMARFAPLVRTFVPVVAGMAGMPYRQFFGYNVAGGIGWVASMTCTGFLLGTRFPWLLHDLEKVILVVLLLSVSPGLWEYARARYRAHAAAKAAGPKLPTGPSAPESSGADGSNGTNGSNDAPGSL